MSTITVGFSSQCEQMKPNRRFTRNIIVGTFDKPATISIYININWITTTTVIPIKTKLNKETAIPKQTKAVKFTHKQTNKQKEQLIGIALPIFGKVQKQKLNNSIKSDFAFAIPTEHILHRYYFTITGYKTWTCLMNQVTCSAAQRSSNNSNHSVPLLKLML